MAISFNKNSLKAIEEPYLLATGISCYVDEKGNRYLHELWVKDIIEHLRYIKKLTLIGPRTDGAPPVDYVNVSSAPDFVNVIYVDLVAVTGTLDALLKLPKIVRTFWRAVQSNFFIHTAVAGWPIPYGWILTPMAIILNKRLIILVESAFWRLTPNVENGFKARTRAAISEYLGSWCVNKADLALFTQEEYKNSLLTNGKSLGYVDPASWIDDVNIVTNIEANISWDLKREMAKDGLNIVYVGKLNSKKGVEILLDALNICESRSVRVNLDILGEGELSARCNDFTKIPRKSVNARMLGTVPYDANFYCRSIACPAATQIRASIFLPASRQRRANRT